MIKSDSHIHTPFCPHGTDDSLERYIERGLELGYRQLTFTEHAPLPEGFTDPTPDRDSGMNRSQLEAYFTALEKVKKHYKKDLTILAGLEVDYIEGFEEQTTHFLNEYGPQLDDSILSVHFLFHHGQYDCLDFSHETFGKLVSMYGSVDAVHQHYYETVLKSVLADLGAFKPQRIGHITLARKFQRRYPWNEPHHQLLTNILDEIRKKRYELDYNGAGTVKPDCGEPYPSDDIVQQAQKRGIQLRYGSDAHQAKDLGQGAERILLF